MKKTLSILLALAVFVAGTALLVGYVRRAEEQVLAREQAVAVLVVSQPLSTGDRPIVRTEHVPQRLVLDDAVLAEDSLNDLVVTVDLLPGEQLVWSRLGAPSEVAEPELARPGLPDGFLAVTIPVGDTQALGGALRPGMRVGVVGSFELPGAATSDRARPSDFVEPTADATFGEDGTVAALASIQSTGIVVHKALVLEVQAQGSQGTTSATVVTADTGVDAGPQQLPTAPDAGFLVTLAASAYDIERIIFASEWGSVWLVEESAEADESTSRVQTPSTIFADGESGDASTDETDGGRGVDARVDNDTRPTLEVPAAVTSDGPDAESTDVEDGLTANEQALGSDVSSPEAPDVAIAQNTEDADQ